jgi:hypothetical protein
METTISGVGAVRSVTARPPETSRQPVAPEHEAPEPKAPAPAPDAPAQHALTSHVDLAAWFDRNGDGRIDTNTWVNGGDAFLRVDKDVSALLDRESVRPRERSHAATHAAASAAYRRYGVTTTADTKP